MKISRELLFKLRCLIKFLKDPPEERDQPVMNYIYGSRRHMNGASPEYVRAIRTALQRGEDATPEAIEVELEGLDAPDRFGDDDPPAPIIERVIRLISKPFAGALPNGLVQDLRRAILSPSERLELLAKLDAQETKCRYCHHTFQQGEMTTFAAGGEEENILACTICVPPTLKRCSSCDEVVATTVGHKPCPKHGEKGKRVSPPEDVGGRPEPRVDGLRARAVAWRVAEGAQAGIVEAFPDEPQAPRVLDPDMVRILFDGGGEGGNI